MENQQEEVTVGADVDVKALMAEVRAEVERKSREGLYPPEVLEESDALGATSDVDQLARVLLGLRHGVSFDTDIATASRIPLAAPLAAAFKRSVKSSVHWYVSAIVKQIEQFDANVLHVLNLLSEELRNREREIAKDRDSINSSIRELELTVRRLEARIDEAIGGPASST